MAKMFKNIGRELHTIFRSFIIFSYFFGSIRAVNRFNSAGYVVQQRNYRRNRIPERYSSRWKECQYDHVFPRKRRRFDHYFCRYPFDDQERNEINNEHYNYINCRAARHPRKVLS